jgi:hypothetical protein
VYNGNKSALAGVNELLSQANSARFDLLQWDQSRGAGDIPADLVVEDQEVCA